MMLLKLKKQKKSMNTKSGYYFVIFLVVAISSASYLVYSIKKAVAEDLAIDYAYYIAEDIETSYKPIPNNTPVILVLPLPNKKLSSPVKIVGKAPGTWFFEATLFVKIMDGNGTVLGQGPAIATSDWMTTSLVPFEVNLPFTYPSTKKGSIIIEADDPSGRGFAPHVSFPVTFATSDLSVSEENMCSGTSRFCMKETDPKM